MNSTLCSLLQEFHSDPFDRIDSGMSKEGYLNPAISFFAQAA